MTLEEQFKKETGTESFEFTEATFYTNAYVEWLEEKLTWKRFSEQTPNVGKNIVVKDSSIHYVIYDICEYNIDHIIDITPKAKWMYVPE